MKDIDIEIQRSIIKMEDHILKVDGKKDPLQVLCTILDEKTRKIKALENLLWHSVNETENYKKQYIELKKEIAEDSKDIAVEG